MKKIKADKILDVIGIIWTSIVLIIFLFEKNIINITLKPNIIRTISIVPGIIYLILKKFLCKKRVIIKNELDFAIHLFFFSMFIPIISDTFVSLEGSIEKILCYTQCIIIYNVLKNIFENHITKTAFFRR